MRRSGVFYMGSFLGRRHLNRANSPLLMGYINPVSITSNGSSTVAFQASANSSLASAQLVDGVLAQSLLAKMQLAMTMELLRSVFEVLSGSVATFLKHGDEIMQVEMKQEAFRVEVQMESVQNTCFDLCVKNFDGPDLHIDEVKCLDKCSWKHMIVHQSVCNAFQHAGPDGAVGGQKKRR